jgi:glycosyltransferase involved in cell wall biosynthesis
MTVINKVAYLISAYPMPSQTFVRREILAMERSGWGVYRFSSRGGNLETVDASDVAEAARTKYILREGILSLLAAAFVVLCSSPVRFLTSLKLLLDLIRPSERPLYVHLTYLFEACWLARQLRINNIQHIHAHFGTNPATVAMLAHTLSDVPFSFTVHGPEEFDKAGLICLERKVREAEFVVAISSFGRSQLFRLVGQVYWNKIHVIHCGVDQSFADVSLSGCTNSRFVCVGRLCARKGHLLLVSAAARLARKGMKFEIVLVGDGEMRSAIEGLIARHRLQQIVTISGWANGPAVRREILSARAMILPSFAEGLPVAIMEAMALGRPVLSTYVAGIPELVIDGETGWLVPAGDENALVAAMEACLNADGATLAQMGEAARKRALARHDVDREAGKLAALFHGIPASQPQTS